MSGAGWVEAARRSALMRRAAAASVATAILLLVVKAWALWQTDSVSILASLADTGLDMAASLITMFAVRVATTPADEDHRFGHGKAEAIAALMQTMLIVMSAALIAWRAGNRFMDGGAVTAPATGIGVSLFAIFVTLLLVGYQRRVARATGSIAIETDRLHYQSDLALNVAVILALVLTGFGLPGADALFGLGIALWLAWNGYRAGRRAVDMLMDREWPELRRQQLLNLVTMLPDVDGVHELRTRRAGDTDFIQFHIWVDPEMTVASAHDITDRAEAAVRAAYPGAELFIHIDPRGHIADHEIEEDPPCPPASAT